MKKHFKSLSDTVKMYAVLVRYAKGLSALSLLLSLISGLVSPFSALLMSYLAASLSQSIGFGGVIIMLVSGIIVIRTFSGLSSAVQGYIGKRIQQKIELPLKLLLQENASRFDCRWHEKQEFAQMLEMSSEAINPMRIVDILNYIPELISALISFSGSAILLASAKWYLPVMAVFFGLLSYLFGRRFIAIMNEVNNAGSGERLAANEIQAVINDQAGQAELRTYGKQLGPSGSGIAPFSPLKSEF